jgi:hypothetical protein
MYYNNKVSLSASAKNEDINVENALQHFIGDKEDVVVDYGHVADRILDGKLDLSISTASNQSLMSKSSNISGDNVNIKSGIMTNIISSNMNATDTINMDAGVGLNVVGLPDKIGANESINISIGKKDDQYEFGISGGLGVDISNPNKSNITATNGISGKAEYILDINSEIGDNNIKSHTMLWDTPVISGNILSNGASGNVDFNLNAKYNNDSKLLNINNTNIQLPQGAF